MLRLVDLTVGYRSKRRDVVVAKGIDLVLNEGEFVCLLGANGAGKSTLLRTVAGMQPPLAGQVFIDDADLSRCSTQHRARLVSVVLTERMMAGLLSGYVMVSLGRYPHTGWFGTLSPEDEQVVETCLRLAGAEPFRNRLVGELSDGERQRVMLARALAQQPRLLVLDEITAFLDLPRRVEVMELLRGLARESGHTILISTHDLDLAIRNADRVLLMAQDGVLHDGAPEDLVMNGAFADAFRGEGIAFDPMQGAFQICRSTGATIRLNGGSQLQRIWTQRAIERSGYSVCEAETGQSNAVAEIEILETGGWTLSGRPGTGPHRSIYDLLRALPAPGPTLRT